MTLTSLFSTRRHDHALGGSTGLTLRVTRSTPLNPSAAGFDKTVSDSVAVQRLYDAAIALPPAPNGVYNCPASRGVVYHLAFHEVAAPMQHMDLEADGCQFLSIGQSQEQHLTNPDFLSLFTQTIGIASLT
jgi:hypothetical protein